jgi:hypothetical protein
VYSDGTRKDLTPGARMGKTPEEMQLYFQRQKAEQALKEGSVDIAGKEQAMEINRERLKLAQERGQGSVRAAPAGYQWNGERLEPIPGGPADKPEKLTDVQGRSSTYGQRAAEAHAVIESVGKDGKVQPGLIKRALEAVPIVGSSLGTIANATQSPEQQQVEQAQRNFVNAVLRRESGAVISDAEFDNARKQYFPQPGDSAAVIKQKKANRDTVIRGFADEAGPAKSKVLEAGKGSDSMPDPSAHAGRSITDTKSGIRYKSDGKRWVKQ